MIGILVRGAALAGVYLLVLTSVAPGDVLIGLALGLAIAVALRRKPGAAAAAPAAPIAGVLTVLASTAGEMVRGSWRTVRFCLGAPASPGLVDVPRGDRSHREVAAWGVLTGEAPDEVVVGFDDERDVMIVHVLDGADAEAVRARHRRNHQRWRGRA